MVNLQNFKDYEASLNNILHKTPPWEVGVERIVTTLLNDILSDLVKWPKLSAEETSPFTKSLLEDIYGLIVTTAPDGMILDDSVTYQQVVTYLLALTPPPAQGGNKYICSHALIEVKPFDADPTKDVFAGKEALKVIQKLREKLKNDSDIKNIIEEILCKGRELGRGDCAELENIKNDKWKVKVRSTKNTIDKAYPIKIIDSSEATVATLHQLDTYLLECYLYDKIKGVIWTNGLCWKIWTKDALGNINNIDPANPDFKLDKDQHGYVKDVRLKQKGKYYAVPVDFISGDWQKPIDIAIDPNYFAKFIGKLIDFLSTL